MSDEVIEEVNVITDALSRVEARVIIFLIIFVGLCVLRSIDKLSEANFVLALSLDGLLAYILKKV